MIDNPTAQAAVENIYDFVLIASERIREINRERINDGSYSGGIDSYKNLEKPHQKACREIVSGEVGREYLKKIGERAHQNKSVFR